MFYNSYKGDGASMVESIGNILNEIPKVLTNIKPDLILAGFDIGANFAIVVTGAHLNIPIAHIRVEN